MLVGLIKNKYDNLDEDPANILKTLVIGCLVLTSFIFLAKPVIFIPIWLLIGALVWSSQFHNRFFQNKQTLVITPNEIVILHSLPFRKKKYIRSTTFQSLSWNVEHSAAYVHVSSQEKPIRLFVLNRYDVNKKGQELVDKIMLVFKNVRNEDNLGFVD